jgi:hypothetical protein
MSEAWRPGDEVVFFGSRYTLLEPTWAFGWLAVETDKAWANPRVILTEYLRRAPARSAGPP